MVIASSILRHLAAQDSTKNWGCNACAHKVLKSVLIADVKYILEIVSCPILDTRNYEEKASQAQHYTEVWQVAAKFSNGFHGPNTLRGAWFV